MNTRRPLRLLFCVTVLSTALLAQSPNLTFDVAAIHPSAPHQLSGGIKAIPGGHGYTAHNINAKLMISLMYKIPMRQIHGGPDWLEADRWDVEARADGSYNVDDLHEMYKNLLQERFGLKFHINTVQGNVYALTINPAGLKMQPNNTPQDYAIPVNGPPAHVVGKRVPMNYLCWWLGLNLRTDERPVIDKTGLTGNYDFTLSFAPLLSPGDSANETGRTEDLPSIFVALKNQLGLKLTPEKGPVDSFIIDSVEKPSQN